VSLETYRFPPGSIVAAGDTWLAVDGQRITYQASHSHVIYSLIRPRNGVRQIITLLPDMLKFIAAHTPTLLNFIIWSIVDKLMDHITGVVGDKRAVTGLADGMSGRLGIAGFQCIIRSLGYALGAVKDILQFVLVQCGELGAAEVAARVNTIKQVAARVGNAIDDPTATKIVNEIVASAAQLLARLARKSCALARNGRQSAFSSVA
jgi:hypothetical protein